MTLEVPRSLDGVRVDKAVALLADLSRSSVDTLIDEGRVQVDGATVRSRSTPLRSGQQLRVDPHVEVTAAAPIGDPSVVFTVVYEDPDLIVVDKPAGLVVHPGAGHRTGTLVHGLVDRFPELPGVAEATATHPDRPGIVHRLDRGTSGLMVVARTPEAYRFLVDQAGGASGVQDLPGPGARDGEGGVRADRRPGGPVGRRSHPDGGVPPGQGGEDPVPGRGTVHHARPRPPCWPPASRPDGPIRYGCTWPPSATRWPATRSTAEGGPSPALR